MTIIVQIRSKLVVALAIVALAHPARSAERVLLTNGFDMRCDHHAQVGPVIRLYMGHSDASYIDFRPGEIRSFETIPDPPPHAVASAPANPHADAKLSAKLSPADLRQMLADAGQQHNLDIDLLASVVKAESNGNSRAVSRAGARGLMQLMPKTAAQEGVDDSFQPGENVRGGSAYLDELLVRYHDNLAIALAAYNAGPAAVARYHGIPPYHETRAYVARVIHEFNRRVLAREQQARQTQPAALARDSATR